MFRAMMRHLTHFMVLMVLGDAMPTTTTTFAPSSSTDGGYQVEDAGDRAIVSENHEIVLNSPSMTGPTGLGLLHDLLISMNRWVPVSYSYDDGAGVVDTTRMTEQERPVHVDRQGTFREDDEFQTIATTLFYRTVDMYESIIQMLTMLIFLNVTTMTFLICAVRRRSEGRGGEMTVMAVEPPMKA